MTVSPYDRLTVCPSLVDIVRVHILQEHLTAPSHFWLPCGPRALAFNCAYRGHLAAVHVEAPERRELTIIINGISITNYTHNVEVSKIGAERTGLST